jgi:ABC-type transport system involved in multi-copper enzyme maturation permease subunit
VIATLASVTWLRLRRGRALWIGVAIAVLPVLYAALHHGALAGALGPLTAADLMTSTTPLLVLLPALFVTSSLADELETRTSAYLWSRPIARWQVLAGKLCAVVPVVTALVLVAWIAGHVVGLRAPPSAASCVALVLGVGASALAALGLTTLVPRQALAIAIGYMLVDTFVGALPFALAQLSMTYQVRVLSGLSTDPQAFVQPIVVLAILGGAWGALAVRQIQRREA